jgi:hypothetical protein
MAKGAEKSSPCMLSRHVVLRPGNFNFNLNWNCIPVLSLSGNPNFSLLLPNPGNRSQCLKSLSKHTRDQRTQAVK